MTTNQFITENLSHILQRYRIETAEQTADGQFRISAKPVGTITVRTLLKPEGKRVRIKRPAKHCEGVIDYKEIDNYLTNTGDPYGSICFDVWRDHDGEQPGWLYNFFHNADDPLGVVFGLKQDGKLIATLAFEDVDGLKKRLTHLAEMGSIIDPENWTANIDEPEVTLSDRPINRINIPLGLLLDMCKIDMVAGPNYLAKLPNKDTDVQFIRYDFLRSYALGQFRK